jgi:heparosan-N-sulfate-glucuronate 5-epimerase
VSTSSVRDVAPRRGGIGRLVLYMAMFRHWAGMLGGRGYWHVPQGLGSQFARGTLAGYFNDLTGKVHWSGPVDENGLLLNRLPSGELVYFPTAVVQKSLGHWDVWLASGRRSVADRDAFLAGARWCLDRQDEQGGWTAWSQLGLHYQSPYSAMTQGEAVSLLVRAFDTTRDARFVDAARRAIDLMLLPTSAGGVARGVPEGLVLEEAAQQDESTVLNGWIFSLFGLHDFLLVRGDEEVSSALDRTVAALCAWLPRFEGPFWSRYDTRGTIASPFYHHLHIAQLAALEIAFPERSATFAATRRRFELQAGSRVQRFRAVAAKVVQKLRNPPQTILR